MTGLSKRATILISVPLGIVVQYFFASVLLSEGSFQFHLGVYTFVMYPSVLAIWRFITWRQGTGMFQSSQGWGFLAFVFAGMSIEVVLIALNLLYVMSISELIGIFVNAGYAVFASYVFLGFVFLFAFSVDKLQVRVIRGKLLKVGDEYDLSIIGVNNRGLPFGKIGHDLIFVPGVGQAWHGRVRITQSNPGVAQAVPVT